MVVNIRESPIQIQNPIFYDASHLGLFPHLFLLSAGRGLAISFQDYRLIGDRPFIGFDNYLRVLKDPVFWEVFQNTIVIGAGSFIINFFCR